jgi:hypothetical protein
MPYYSCPSCLLSVHARGIAPPISNCPRCLARRQTRVALYRTGAQEQPTLAVRRTLRETRERQAPRPPAA